MSTIAEDDRRVIAGVDTHKEFHVVVVLDEQGRKLDTATFAATPRGYRDLTSWVTGFGEVLAVGVEGTASWGAGLSRHLRARWQHVRCSPATPLPDPSPAMAQSRRSARSASPEQAR
jgi:transposase